MSDPTSFERDNGSYIGYAIAIQTPSGRELIILAPTADEAEFAAENYMATKNINRDQIKRAALVGMVNFDKLRAAAAIGEGL